MPVVILLCRCHSFSNGVYPILERKLLKPHSKCYTVSRANCREEVWRRFLNTLVCQSLLPLPPTQTLRIISFPPVCIPHSEWIWAMLSQTPFKNYFLPAVAVFLKDIQVAGQSVQCLPGSIGSGPKADVIRPIRPSTASSKHHNLFWTTAF